MAVHLRVRKTKSGGTYYLDIDYNGKRWYERTDLKYKNNDLKSEKQNLELQAKACRSRREISLSDGETIPKVKSETNFLAFFQSRIDSYTGKNTSRLKSIKKHFETFIGSDRIRFCDLNKMLLKDFRKHLDTILKYESPSDYFQKLRSILNDAVDSGYLKKNPAVGVKNPNPYANQLRKEVLFDYEVIELSKTRCQNLELRRACLFSCLTGLGWSEINRLKWSNIDIPHSYLSISRSKTGEAQQVPLNETAMQLLGMPREKNEYIFNLKLSQNGANKTIKAWVNRAGIKKHITFYCFRHSFITNILFHTGNLKLASSLAGHTTTRHTEKYAHLVDSSRRDAVNKLPGFAVNDNG